MRRLIFSYVGQFTNLVVGVAMLPLILAFLDRGEFLVWSLFTTIAGVFLQAEMAVQAIVSRGLAGGEPGGERAALARAKTTYHRFAALAFVALLAGGGAYFALVRPAAGSHLAEWAVFVATYGANYALGYNNCFLIAREATTRFNLNAMTSRVTNLVLLAGLLAAGLRLWALVISFALSVVLNVMLNRRAALRLGQSAPAEAGEPGMADRGSAELGLADPKPADRRAHLWLLGLFLVLSFWAYRVILPVATAVSGETDATASLALALQLYAIFALLALTPMTMRVTPLVHLLGAGRLDEAAVEFARIHLLVVGGMAGCIAALLAGIALFGDTIRFDVAWPGPALVLALGAGYLVEANLQAMANVFIARRAYGFMVRYSASVALGLVLAGLAARFAHFSIAEAILVVAATQASIALPALFAELRRQIPLRPASYAAALTGPFRVLRM